jgi:hypothetical protein
VSESSNTSIFALEDRLHRLVKEALDSGAARSLEEAEAMFRRLVLRLDIAESAACDPENQVALLTAVALAKRVFLGGVWVSEMRDVPLRVPLALQGRLADAVTALGGVHGEPPADCPWISIGSEPRERSAKFHIRTAQSGWRGGILPVQFPRSVQGGPRMPLAAMLAAALAVNEAFRFARTGNCAFGRQPIGMSLWNPSPAVDWLTEPNAESELKYLPARLWLLGLGHLGQAYLWALGILPYACPAGLSLVLQDVDLITPSTESTSILTSGSFAGRKKTRVMADWAEQRGFTTVIHERLFAAGFKRQPDEPGIALCGLDNALGRRALGEAGFDLVVEAGLGRGHQDYRTIRLHTLPGSVSAEELWKMETAEEPAVNRPGYQTMLEDSSLGVDRCGITLLAGKAVGAPFVGAVASCLAVSEVLRLLHGGPVHQMIDLDLQGIEYRSVVENGLNFSRMNPGYVDVRW